MSENVTNELLLEHLKRIQDTLATHTRYHVEQRERIGFLEQQYASISRRVDRIDERLERIEVRLDLADGRTVAE